MMKRFSLRFDMDKKNEASAYRKLINDSEKLGISKNAYIISLLNSDVQGNWQSDALMVSQIVDGVVRRLSQAVSGIPIQDSGDSKSHEQEEEVSDEMADFMSSF